MSEVKSAIVGDNIARIDITELSEFQGNLKDLSSENYVKLKNEILELGFSFVIHAWKNDGKLYILDGHQRTRTLMKMREEGFTVPKIPVVLVQADDYKQAKKKVLAGTSQFGEMTGQGLYEFIGESGLDWRDVIRENRFPEIDPVKFVEEFFDPSGAPAGGGSDDDVPDNVPSIAKPGDIFQLGEHRLMCGDSTNLFHVERLMDERKADMVFTSPPYNVGIKYNAHNDKMSTDDYTKMILAVMENCFEVMDDGRLIGWNIGVSPKSKPYVHAMMLEDSGFDFYRHIVWKKTGAQIPLWNNSQKKPVARYYMPNYNHELVYMASKGAVVTGGATQMPEALCMDVWDVSQFAAGGNNHPAAFPVHLVEMAMSVMSAPNENVFEPFTGSGSTMIAAEKSNRRFFGIEIDPHYVDVAIARWEKFSGKQARLIPGPA